MSIILQLSKYASLSQEKRRARGKVRRHAFCNGDRTTPSHHAIAAIRASRWIGRGRNPVGVGHSELHAFAPPGETQERGTCERAPPKYLFAVHGQHGSAPGTSAIPLCRMLHSKQSSQTAKYRSAL